MAPSTDEAFFCGIVMAIIRSKRNALDERIGKICRFSQPDKGKKVVGWKGGVLKITLK